MEIRTAELDDLPVILELFSGARKYMREHGNPTQWGETGPGNGKIFRDIENGDMRVLYDDEGIHACFSLLLGPDPTYSVIREGSWKSDKPYAVLHRAASDGRVPGMLREMIDYASGLYDHLRCDTHRNNHGVQEKLLSYGFEYCGIINVDDGSERLAYERTEED